MWLVFVAAFAPDEGERLGEVEGTSKDSVFGSVLVPHQYPTASGPSTEFSIDPAKDAALLAVAGIGLTFGMWWMYFVVPWGEVLERHRARSYLWSAGHLLLFGAIAAAGAGLHVAAYFLEGLATLSTTATVLTVAVPVAVFVLALYAIGSACLRQRDPFHLLLLAGTAGALGLAVVCAEMGVSMSWCLVVLTLAPAVTVLGYETVGHRHLAEAMLQN